MIIKLLAIDVQNDFCNKYGSLYVDGAYEDTLRLSNMLDKLIERINSVHITLDSHSEVCISHPIFWINNKGENPKPFTIISEEDVINGVWISSNIDYRTKSIEYVKSLSKNNRYSLCIYPPHCILGTYGWNIEQHFSSVLSKWSKTNLTNVDYHFKGLNMFTEHYSAFKADVIDETDSSTLPNVKLIEQLSGADEILVAGQARSHCVASTMYDLVDELGLSAANRFVLLTDTMSDVTGFEHLGEKFYKDMIDIGVRIATTQDYIGGICK